jgi:hypothetical protein
MARLGRLWQMLSIDLPQAVSNWLWANIINPLLAGLRELKLRQIALAAAILFMVWSIAEANPFGLHLARAAAMFAGDTAIYAEIVSFAMFAIVRGHIHRAIMPAARMLRFALRRAGPAVLRVAARTRRLLRRPRVFDRNDADDVPDGTFAFA